MRPSEPLMTSMRISTADTHSTKRQIWDKGYGNWSRAPISDARPTCPDNLSRGTESGVLAKSKRRAEMKVPYDVVLPQVNVLGSTIAYREAGNPDAPVALFLHGNPTSSYLWRKVIPLVAPTAHCTAPQLIGFGQSGKPDIEYRFADHVRYFDAFLANAGISSAFVIAHDWGTALAFHLAARRPQLIRCLAFMDLLSPMPTSEHS